MFKTFFSLAFISIAGAASAQSALTLSIPPALHKDLSAMPRILTPVTPETTKINSALTKADLRARQSALECKSNAEQGTNASWERTVSTTMRGPAFLSLVAEDSYFCGGAHPDEGTVTLTYDLKTGAPVNWARLLPQKFVQKTNIGTADDGTPVGTVSSPALNALYLKAALSGMDAGMKNDCKDALSGEQAFILWMDAKRNGVGIKANDLPHVAAACASEEVLAAATLKKIGADPDMIEAIDAAHKAHNYDEKAR